MDAVCITYPIETFSRFNFFYQKSSKLQLRQRQLKQVNYRTATKELQSFRFVRLYSCKSPLSEKFPIEVSELLENWERDNAEIGEMIRYYSLKSFEKCQSPFENSISLLFVNSNTLLDFVNLEIPNLYIVFIVHDDDQKTRFEIQTEDKVKFTTAKKNDILTSVNYLLERVSLAPLKQIAEECYDALEKDKKTLSAETAETLPSLISDNIGDKIRTVKNENEFRDAKLSTIYQRGAVVDDNDNGIYSRKRFNPIYKQSKSRTTFQFLTNEKKGKRKRPTETDTDQDDCLGVKCRSMDLVDTTESLLEAILALYRMSNVPDTDKPNVPTRTYKVSKKMRDELFKICPSIKRMGYRYRTFTVYAVEPEKYADVVKLNGKIDSVLKSYGIDKFDLVPCTNDIIPLTHAGAKVEARSGTLVSLRSRTVRTDEIIKHGTLGCIVTMSDGQQCGLLSKHVTLGCSEVYYNNDNQKEKLGDIIPETNMYRPESLDISAALMDRNVDDTQRKFENMQGRKVKGQLYRYNEDQEGDEIFGMGQPVFIRGASTNPGKGEITMPFVDVGLSTPHIQVEDAVLSDGTVEERFAKEGDSGAVVCADVPDNYAHAVGMVIGTSDIQTDESFMKTRRMYLALPLSKGIEQLEADTGRTFNL